MAEDEMWLIPIYPLKNLNFQICTLLLTIDTTPTLVHMPDVLRQNAEPLVASVVLIPLILSG